MSRIWLTLTRVWLLLALLGSAVLYTHYLDPEDSEFCGARSGCEVLRQSKLGYFFGSRFVSLPLFGMIAFAVVLAISLWPRRSAVEARRVVEGLFYLCAFGALTAIGLVAYQAFKAHAYCWLCLIVDGSAVLAGISAFAVQRSVRKVESSEFFGPVGLKTWAWAGLGALVVAAPLAWNVLRPVAPIPAEVRALYQPGKINVVEFADYECPYCRRLYPLLNTVMESYPGQVNFVRLNMPLDMHPMAEPAARAAICAEQLNPAHAEEMTDKLFTERLHKKIGEKLAADLGYDPQAFAQCLPSETTTARLKRDASIVHATGFRGLPTTYIGSRRILGVKPEAVFRDAFDHAAAGEGIFGVPGPVYLAASAFLAFVLIFSGWLRGRPVAAVMAVEERGTLQDG